MVVQFLVVRCMMIDDVPPFGCGLSLRLPPLFFVLATSDCFVIWNTTSCFCDCLPPAFSSLQSPSYSVASPSVRIVFRRVIWFSPHLLVASTRRVSTSWVVIEIDSFCCFCLVFRCIVALDSTGSSLGLWELFWLDSYPSVIKNVQAGCFY